MAGDNVVQPFQLTDEYNGILLSWYFKGFKMLRRYLTKHNPEVDLEGLDFEVVDKEMEVKRQMLLRGLCFKSLVMRVLLLEMTLLFELCTPFFFFFFLGALSVLGLILFFFSFFEHCFLYAWTTTLEQYYGMFLPSSLCLIFLAYVGHIWSLLSMNLSLKIAWFLHKHFNLSNNWNLP